MKRRLIIGGGIAVIVLCLAGIVAVVLGLARWSGPEANPPPWKAGRPFAPVPVGDDPKLISYATAELIRARMETGLDLGDASFDTTYAFDEDATAFEREKPGPPELIAAVSASQDGPALDAYDRIRAHLQAGLYADTAARDTALRVDAEDSRHPSRVVAEPRVTGASAVRVVQLDGACSSGRGRSSSVHGTAALGTRTTLTVTMSCTTSGQAAALVDPVVTQLREAVAALAGIEDRAIPETLFDRAAEVPVISGGSWSDRQVVIDPAAGDRGLAAVPASLRAPGVELYVEGRDEVAAYRDAATVTTLLDRVLAAPDHHDRKVVERSKTAADRTICAEGFRPREPSECLSQVGRFLVVANADQGQDPDIDDQLKLLRDAA